MPRERFRVSSVMIWPGYGYWEQRCSWRAPGSAVLTAEVRHSTTAGAAAAE